MQELGYKNVDVIMWRGLAAKKGISANEVKILEEAAKKYAASAAYKDASEKIGFEINFLNSQDFSKKIASDDLMIGKLSAELGLKEVKN
jgi:tripartite-type tricarboxylate transporter receptor subunit TctC